MADWNTAESSPSAARAQPMQYTKRKHFLFFKIRSKPIYPSGRGRAARGGADRYGWLIGLVVAAAVALTLRFYQFPLPITAVASITIYIAIFGVFMLAGLKKQKTENIKKQIERGAIPKMPDGQNVLGHGRETPLQAEHRISKEGQKHNWQGKPVVQGTQRQERVQMKQGGPGAEKGGEKAKGPVGSYIKSVASSRRDLEMDLREVGIKKSPYEFVKTMMIYAIIITAVVVVVLGVLLAELGIPIILAPLMGIAVYMMSFNRFMMYPSRRARVVGKLVERDILFAARDVVIGMRSGMPLYNAMTAVSTGYGETSKQFGRIIEMVQLGMPIEQAMEEVSEKSESSTFKRLMLQASTSIKAGVDVTDAIQGVVDEVMQERIIDLRRYGQKLNALAMFYMLFGVIFPSMGIAVATIMSTFINIFPITYVVLILGLIFIAIVQIVLLNIMKSSRPIFVM